MKKISKSELARLHKRGGVIGTPRSLAEKKPAEPKVKKDRDVGMASMAATQKFLAEQNQELTNTISNNSKKIEEFREGLKEVVAAAGKRSAYEFDIKRKGKLIDKIIATPIKE